jgi:DhnA family fructose-bisphosphate aldolase class Ia
MTTMTELGKQFRMKRVIDDTGVSIICAIDHGMTSPVLLDGLDDTPTRVREAIAGGANVFMLSRGMARLSVKEFRKDTALAFMLSASAAGCPRPNIVTAIASVEEALRVGADAVVVFVALGGDSEPEMIEFVGKVGAACADLGMPFIAEAEYPTTYMSLDKLTTAYGPEYLLRNSRLCAELGADIVKTNWIDDVTVFERLVRATSVPVVLAGGSRVTDEELLRRMDLARKAGAIGCSVGRNIFQHQNPMAITRSLSRIFRDQWTARQATEELRETLLQPAK